MSVAQESNPQMQYSIKTDLKRNVVEIHVPGLKALEVGSSSLPSVTNILSAFWNDPDTRLQSNTILTIKDEFSGSTTTVTVDALRDVAKVLASVVKSPSAKSMESSAATPQPSHSSTVDETAPVKKARGRPKKVVATEQVTESIPTQAPTPVEATPKKRGRPKKSEDVVATPPTPNAEAPVKRGRGRPKKSESLSAPQIVATEPKKRGRPKKVTVPAEPITTDGSEKVMVKKQAARRTKKDDSMVSSAPAPQLAARGRGRPSRAETEAKLAMEAATNVPEWFLEGPSVYAGGSPDGTKFLLIKTPLSLEEAGSRNVLGAAAPGERVDGFGFEVTSDGQHVAWVIAEAEDAYYLAGVAGEESTRMRNLGSLIAKIVSKVVPMIQGDKQAA